ncbi:MAG: hypothetical protein U0074_06750 [Kouleothrix sp.]
MRHYGSDSSRRWASATTPLLLDCRDLNYQPVPLPADAQIVVCDSHTERRLAGSYNDRRDECDQAVQLFRQWYRRLEPYAISVLPVSPARGRPAPGPVRARARHLHHRKRPRGAWRGGAQAGDVATFGQLMNASHTSLRDGTKVSIDMDAALVAAAQRVPGCYGSRMTGAGFGGCTVNLVETASSNASSVMSQRPFARPRARHNDLCLPCQRWRRAGSIRIILGAVQVLGGARIALICA